MDNKKSKSNNTNTKLSVNVSKERVKENTDASEVCKSLKSPCKNEYFNDNNESYGR